MDSLAFLAKNLKKAKDLAVSDIDDITGYCEKVQCACRVATERVLILYTTSEIFKNIF